MMPWQNVPVVESEVYAELPHEMRIVGRESSWIQVQRNGKPAGSVLEGPVFDRNGSLFVSDIPWGRIFKIDENGTFSLVYEYDGEPNGLAFHRDGRLYIADFRNGILSLDLDSQSLEVVVDRDGIEGLKGVNDLVFDLSGNLYFTDQGLTGVHDPTGRVFRLSVDGQLDMVLWNVPSPNGIALTSDASVLFVAATRGNCVWRVPLLPNGRATKAGVYVQLSGGHGPDGLAVDDRDHLYVAHVGAGRVLHFDSHGELVEIFRSARDRVTTNLTFGPPDTNEIYITESESGSVLRSTTTACGQPVFSHQ